MPCPVSSLPQLHRAASPEVTSSPGPPKLLSGWGGGGPAQPSVPTPAAVSRHWLPSLCSRGSSASPSARPGSLLLLSEMHISTNIVYSILCFWLGSREPALWPLASVHAKSSQSCPTLCSPMDTTARQAPLSTGLSRQQHWSESPWPPPGDLRNPGIEPASLMSPTLAGRFFPLAPPSLNFKWFSRWVMSDSVTLWTVARQARQAPLSTGFSRQESWSELPSSPSYNSSASSLSSPPGYGSSSSKQETFVIHPNLSPSAPCGLTHHSLNLLKLCCSEACSLQTICVIQIFPL